MRWIPRDVNRTLHLFSLLNFFPWLKRVTGWHLNWYSSEVWKGYIENMLSNLEISYWLLLVTLTRNCNFLPRLNFWGYSTVNYFSPMIRYSSSGIDNCGRDAINEFKHLVKEAHKRGIEVRADSNLNKQFCFETFFYWFLIEFYLSRFSWMSFSITQLKAMRKVQFYHLEVLITVSITC